MSRTAPATTGATRSTRARSSASSAGARPRPSRPASARPCSGTWTTPTGCQRAERRLPRLGGTVVGTGYVGLVTGACLAEMGNHVVCLDVDAQDRSCCNAAAFRSTSPGWTAMVQRNVAAGRLQFTTDVAAAVAHGTCSSSAWARRPTRTARPTCSTCWRRRATSAPHDRLQGGRRQEHGAGGHGRQGARGGRRRNWPHAAWQVASPSCPTPSS
jgi:hypothetical protein